MAGQDNKPTKVILVGDGGVGKTVWLKKVLGDHVPHHRNDGEEGRYMPTLGVDTKHMTIGGTELAIWDCAGTERFKGLGEGFFVGADLCIAFSRDDMPGSARNVQDKWIPMVEKVAPNVRIALAHPDDTGILHRMYE